MEFTLTQWISSFLFLAVYILPSLIAQLRHHPSTLAIQSINIFLGWTFAGWVISLAWAVQPIKTK